MLTSLIRQRLRHYLFRFRYGTRANYFSKRGYLFIHIPKNAGTSLSRSLGLPGQEHFTLENYAQEIDPDRLEQLFKFCIVRNPVDRIVSAFRYLKRHQYNDGFRSYFKTYNIDCFDSADQFVQQWLNQQSMWTNYLTGTQSSFISIGNKVAVDCMFSFENLPLMYEELNSRLGMSIKAQHVNVSSGQKEILSDASIRIVQDLYRDDFEIYEQVVSDGFRMVS